MERFGLLIVCKGVFYTARVRERADVERGALSERQSHVAVEGKKEGNLFINEQRARGLLLRKVPLLYSEAMSAGKLFIFSRHSAAIKLAGVVAEIPEIYNANKSLATLSGMWKFDTMRFRSHYSNSPAHVETAQRHF